VRRIELELQDRLAQALRRYANAYQQANRYKQEILPRAQQSLDLVTRGYASGQVDFLTLLTSQRTYIRVNLAYLSTLDDLWQAATLIEGQLLSGSLQGDSQLKISEQGMSGPGM
jgi:cobalt-zinc-cadmium efflux system outer membrane protein